MRKSGNNSGTFQKGADPRRGRGPAKGAPNAGRPPSEFKEWCKALLNDDTNREQVEKVLANADHPAYKEMWKAIADRAHGKPSQAVELTGKDGEAIEHVHRVLRWGGVEIPL